MTRREEIVEYLKVNPSTITELAVLHDVTPSVIAEDIEHIFRSLKKVPEQLLIKPAECQNPKCKFVFPAHRKKFSDPKKCPECHSERIIPQTFKIA